MLALLSVLGPPASGSPAATVRGASLRRLATNITGLSSDRSRYVVWTTAQNGVVTYDSFTGRRHDVAVPVSHCTLPSIGAIHATEAVIVCYPSPQFLLNLVTGTTSPIPPAWPIDFGVTGIGSGWLRSTGPCAGGPLPSLCDILLNRQTGELRQQPRQSSTVLNLDAPEPTPVVRCDPKRGQFTTPTYDGHNYLVRDASGNLILRRCGGRSTALSRDGFYAADATIGSGIASWRDGGAVFAYRLDDRITYRYSVGPTFVAVTHTSRAIFAASEIQEDRGGSFTATLLTARIPVARSR
ncbi:MAG TPA: hypothetical protein VI318_14830 [Baekduia sp.]